jgi:hypothetical protein
MLLHKEANKNRDFRALFVFGGALWDFYTLFGKGRGNLYGRKASESSRRYLNETGAVERASSVWSLGMTLVCSGTML